MTVRSRRNEAISSTGQFAVSKQNVGEVLSLIGEYNRSGTGPLGLEIRLIPLILPDSGEFRIGITIGATIVITPIQYTDYPDEIVIKYQIVGAEERLNVTHS